jgi:3-keto-L-gulonate-6-phosphate decarboxylase
MRQARSYIVKVPWIQVSVDTQDVHSGLKHVEHALAINAEWIEVGTPLITFAGIEAIAAVASKVGSRTVVADFKALDGVSQYFTRAGELGAGVATVMAVANEASIIKAIEAGHAAGVKIQVDMLGTPTDKLAQKVKKLSDMGADYILLHLAIDELLRNPGADPLEGLDELVAATDLPIGPVVFNAEQGVEALRRGASYLVIGYPLITMSDARDQLTAFAQTVRAALDS